MENEIIKLAGEFWDQIGEFKEEEPKFPYSNSFLDSEEFKESMEKYWILYDNFHKNLSKFQTEQMQNLIEKSVLSSEMKEKVLTLSIKGYREFLNENNFIVDAITVS